MSIGFPVWVMRPEPGNAVTCARLFDMGFRPMSLPLFAAEPLAWHVPDATAHDALLLTSANAVRHAGEGLARLSALPVYAVGEATAKAARVAGLNVVATGANGVTEMAARLADDGRNRVLHLRGQDVTAPPHGFAPTVRLVYHVRERAEAEVLPELIAAPRPAHVLLHSARAALRFRALVTAADLAQSTLYLHTISSAVTEAAGAGWGDVTTAHSVNEAALLSDLPK